MNPTGANNLALKRLDTEQARAQLELKDRVLAACAEGIAIADARLPDNPLIYVNAGFERITGYSAAGVIGRNCRFLQGSGTDPLTLELLRSAIREKREITVQLLNYRKDGTPFWNRLSVTPVRDPSGAVTHFIGVQSDVTAEVRSKEELQRANEQLEAATRAMKRDLQASAELQSSLLPRDLPESAEFSFAYRFRPSSDVGGDALNILPLDPRHTGVYILDVSGHGVASALLSVTLTHMLSVMPDRSFLYHTAHGASIAPPAEVVSRLNRHFLATSGPLRFFTMIYGILDQETAEFRYAAAGHLGPIHVAAGRAPAVCETGGIPVGLIAGAAYRENTVTLSPGDRLYICTDGIFEAETAAGEEFGIERLIAMLDASRNSSLGDALTGVMARVEQWCAPADPADDVSILAIERA